MANLTFLPLSEVVPEDVSWLWPRWVPRGALTLMVGQPGVGKSSMSWDLLARLTSGSGWPDGSPSTLGRGLIVSGEDHLGSWIVPQLQRYGADMSRLDSIDTNGATAGGRALRLDKDCGLLEAYVRDSGIDFVVIDPLDAFLGDINPNYGSEIRTITSGLAGMAARTGAAVIVLHHFNKNEKGSMVNRAAGSIDIIGAARTVLYVVEDPSDAKRRALFVAKSNLGETSRAILFEQDLEGRLLWSAAPDDFDWRRSLSAKKDGVVEEAEAFLLVLMEEHEGEVRSSLALHQATEAGISKHALDKAKASLGIRSERRGGANGYWAFCVKSEQKLDS